MTEATKEKLFQYLQGKITFEEYEKEKEKAEGCVQPPTESLSTGDCLAGEEDEGDERSTMILNYLDGKISFEEFDNYLETGDSADRVDESTDNVYELDTTQEAEPQDVPLLSMTEPALEAPRRRRARGPKRTLPRDLQGLMGEANLRFARGEYDEAIKMCLEVIRLAPTAPEPFQTLGILYEERGDKEKSLQYSLIGAHLSPKDPEEWARLAEMSLELDNKKQAVMCLNKAVKCAPDKVGLIWERSKLNAELGNMKKLIDDYEQLLELVPPSDGEQYFLATHHLVETYHKAGDTDSAIATMENAFELCPDFVTSEFVNLLAELYLSQKDYESVLEILTLHCGVRLVRAADGNTSRYSSCVVPDALPIDLRVKLIIPLIFFSEFDLIPDIAKPVYAEDVEQCGDLFLDIAEAYIENDCNLEACSLLQKLIVSEKYCSAPAVWLKFAESLNSAGKLVEASDAYKKVVDLVPSNYEARVALSQVLQHLGQTEEALETLNREDDADDLVSDPGLLLHRCHLLLSHSNYDEFYTCARKLLFGHLQKWLNMPFVQVLTHLPRTYKCRRDIMRERFGVGFDRSTVYSDSSSVSVVDLWEIFMKSCRTFNSLKQYDRLEEFGRSCQLVEAFMKDPLKEKEAQFITALAYMKTDNHKKAADVARLFVISPNTCNAAWNFYCRALMLSDDNRHSKFVTRMHMNEPNNLVLQLLNAHCSLLTSFYKRTLHNYFAALRQKPDDPLISLCVGLSFLNIASQSYAVKRHDLVLQAICFFNRYKDLRGECQETFYNLGRATHQVGLLHAAIFYYHKVLTMEPMVKGEEIFDLSKEAAYNLSLIYRSTGSTELASVITERFLVV